MGGGFVQLPSRHSQLVVVLRQERASVVDERSHKDTEVARGVDVDSSVHSLTE